MISINELPLYVMAHVYNFVENRAELASTCKFQRNCYEVHIRFRIQEVADIVAPKKLPGFSIPNYKKIEAKLLIPMIKAKNSLPASNPIVKKLMPLCEIGPWIKNQYLWFTINYVPTQFCLDLTKSNPHLAHAFSKFFHAPFPLGHQQVLPLIIDVLTDQGEIEKANRLFFKYKPEFSGNHYRFTLYHRPSPPRIIEKLIEENVMQNNIEVALKIANCKIGILEEINKLETIIATAYYQVDDHETVLRIVKLISRQQFLDSTFLQRLMFDITFNRDWELAKQIVEIVNPKKRKH